MRGAWLWIVAALLAACSEPDYWAFSSGDDGTRAVVVWISDSPADDASELHVTFESVELRGGQRAVVLASGRQVVEVLSLRNGRRLRLAGADVPVGTYDRLVLSLSLAPGAHRLLTRDGERTLELAAGDEIVDIAGPFVVREGADTGIQVDFDARMSVVEAGGRYELRPACRAMDLAEARFLDGLVVDDRGLPVAGAVVSAQLGGVEVCSGRTDADGGFRLGPVAEGDLTLVATARGYGIAVSRSGTVLELAPGEAGGIRGSAAPDGGLEARLMRDGVLVAVAGIDAGTGGYAFPEVPAGVYDLEIWGPDGLRELRRGVVAR